MRPQWKSAHARFAECLADRCPRCGSIPTTEQCTHRTSRYLVPNLVAVMYGITQHGQSFLPRNTRSDIDDDDIVSHLGTEKLSCTPPFCTAVQPARIELCIAADIGSSQSMQRPHRAYLGRG